MKRPMQQLALALLLAPQGGETADGMQLYRGGRFAEAAAAFRAAIERDGDSAELQWNLALASWRAGDLVAAETAVEKYAALNKDARTDLHAGLLGAVRHAEAKALEQQADQAAAQPAPATAPGAAPDAPPADPLPMLEQALQKASQAKDWFVRGAAAKPTPELLRNTERSLRTIDELQKKIDELKKQREQQKDDKKEQDDKKDEKEDEKKDDQQDKKDEPKPDEPKPDEPKPDEPKPDEKKPDDKQEPKPGEPQEQPEPKPGEDEPKDGKDGKGGSGAPPQGEPKGEPGERNDAPGEGREGKELTAEQLQRLLDQLRKTDEAAKEIRMRAKAGRRLVERDW